MKHFSKKNRSLDHQCLDVTGAPWQVQTAKARFSELFRLARSHGPQLIMRQNKDGVVMLSVEQFNLLVNRQRQSKGLVQFLQQSPFVGLNLDFERSKDLGRDVEL